MRGWQFPVLILLAAVLVLWQSLLQSQPARDRILDELELVASEGGAVVHIGLTIPIRYISHFPYKTGDELRIRIKAFDVRSQDRDALFKRESLVPSSDELPALKEVVYEGDFDGGRYLTLLFSRDVRFDVSQGRDSRSIMVRVARLLPPEPGSNSVSQ